MRKRILLLIMMLSLLIPFNTQVFAENNSLLNENPAIEVTEPQAVEPGEMPIENEIVTPSENDINASEVEMTETFLCPQPVITDTYVTACVSRNSSGTAYSASIYGQNQYGRFTLAPREGTGGITATVQELNNGSWIDIAQLHFNVTSTGGNPTTNVYMARSKQYRIKLEPANYYGIAYLRSYD